MLDRLPAPTWRFYILALTLALPLGLGVAAPLFVGLAASAALALIAAVVADFSLATRPEQIAVRRRHEPRLYLGADNQIELVVVNRGRRVLELRLRDTPPASFRSSTLFTGGEVPPLGEATFSYITRPSTRGVFRFGGVTARWRSPLGFLWRQQTFSLGEEVPVYPNLREVHQYELLARRGLLHELGLRSARQFGRGTEFESLREYLPDDDYRRINWPATARRHQPISTLYETERSQRLIVMLDLGRQMLTRVGELDRLDVAVNAALLLCYVALARGDRVGLLGFGETVQVNVPARRGRSHFYRIVEQLYAVRARPIESDYGAAFTRLRTDLSGRAMIALFTDLGDRDSARTIARYLVPLARHHLPLCIALRDPSIEARARQVPDVSRQVYEKVVASLLLDERRTILDTLRHAGVVTVDAPADQLTPATINRYLELKERARL
jgi:uncharacterized protein (DUF58 family)